MAYVAACRTAWESNGKAALLSQIASRLPVCASTCDRVPGMPASIWLSASSCGLGYSASTWPLLSAWKAAAVSVRNWKVTLSRCGGSPQ